jgi:uroporphyrin-III C-methyltransferase
MSEREGIGHGIPGDLPVFEPGWVWLVGAGPGDPGLLTLHAANALAQADVVVYDALVDARVLLYARQDARIEYAGKRGGKPSPKQRDISLKLIELAREGMRVCRLKGGDPFVFGRGGEEALALVEAGIPFRIVPGISAGIGGLAYAGIPVTHRDINQSVTFLTGHDQSGLTPSSIDWAGVARGAPVIVMYMALKHMAQIAEALLAAGRATGEPVAVISSATTEKQRVLETTLGKAAADIESRSIEPPAIVVVGEVVRMRAALDWLGAQTGRVLVADPLGTRVKEERGETA